MTSHPPESTPAYTPPPFTADPTPVPGTEPYDPQFVTAPYQTPGYSTYAPPAYPGAAGQPAVPYPTYPPAAYPPPPYGATPGYAAAPYPPYGYGPYGTGYGSGPGGLRPSVVAGASIVAYVLAGFLILYAMGLFAGAKFFQELRDGGVDTPDRSGEFVVDGFLNLIAAALLIAGGVQYSSRKVAGRAMVLVGGGIAFALSVYWIARLPSVLLFWAFVAGGLSIAVLVLAVLPAGRRWLVEANQPTR